MNKILFLLGVLPALGSLMGCVAGNPEFAKLSYSGIFSSENDQVISGSNCQTSASVGQAYMCEVYLNFPSDPKEPSISEPGVDPVSDNPSAKTEPPAGGYTKLGQEHTCTWLNLSSNKLYGTPSALGECKVQVTGFKESGESETYSWTITVSSMPNNIVCVDGYPYTSVDEVGNGGQNRPYLICNRTQLEAMNSHCAGSACSENFALGADIDFGFETISPLAGTGMAFEGTFDGQGHAVSNYIISVAGDDVGLFGVIGESGLVKRLTLRDFSVSGNARVGGLAGKLLGKVRSVTVDGGQGFVVSGERELGAVVGIASGSGAQFDNVVVKGIGIVQANKSPYASVGGVVGFLDNYAQGLRLKSSAVVKGKVGIGGVVGHLSGGASLTDSWSSGSVEPLNPEADSLTGIGGVIGSVSTAGSLARLRFSGTVIGGALGIHCGGIVGQIQTVEFPGTDFYSEGIVNCGEMDNVGGVVGKSYVNLDKIKNSGPVIGRVSVGGLVGYMYQGNIKNGRSIARISGEDKVGGLVGQRSVTAGMIYTSFTSGSVLGTTYKGCLIGMNSEGTSYGQSYWNSDECALGGVGDGDSSGVVTVGDGGFDVISVNSDPFARSTSMLMIQESFGDQWDFEHVWIIPPSGGMADLRNSLNP